MKSVKKNPKHLDGVPDMAALIYLDTPNILHNLECRYSKNKIYTLISKILISVNPYQMFDIYSNNDITKYKAAAKNMAERKIHQNNLEPHVFSISGQCYYNMLKYQDNQSIIVCGESGSGKTEAAKHLMRYLAFYEKKNDGVSIEQQVIDVNPILESFGNAKTILNNNSSRFGKFTKLVYGNNKTTIIGCFIETYLLEKSRVVIQDVDERNFHVFYMLSGISQVLPDICPLYINDPNNFHYLNQSGCVVADGWSDHKRLIELCDAMTSLNIDQANLHQIFRITAAVLHFGNINFTDDDDACSLSPSCEDTLSKLSILLGIDPEKIRKRLLQRSISVRNQTIYKSMSKSLAETNRDAISKSIYNGIFNWLGMQINHELCREKEIKDNFNWIGILDVFGFESFQDNSFEQFCINFANERLQQFFNCYILQSEQELYMIEAILWTPMEIPNNQDLIDLIDSKPKGILAILDSECKMPRSTDKTFISNLFRMNPFHSRMKQIKSKKVPGEKRKLAFNGFELRHYAKRVIYNAKDFLPKNNDLTHNDTIILFASSTYPIAQEILKLPNKATISKNKRNRSKKSKTQGSVFSRQLSKLLKTLKSTTPSFVRCIKPNTQKKINLFVKDYAQPQLECGGIVEAVRILKLGYPSRCSYSKIFELYGSILNPTPPYLVHRDFCEAILRCCGDTLPRSEFQLGLSKVFFRPGQQAFLENLLQSSYKIDVATAVRIKRFLRNKKFQRVRGVLKVHGRFVLWLRKMRAIRAIRRTADIIVIIVRTFQKKLRKIRKLHATKTVQCCIRAILTPYFLQQEKKASIIIADSFLGQRSQMVLKTTLKHRMEKRLSQMKEEERLKCLENLRKKREEEEKERQKREKQRMQKLKQKEEEKRKKIEQDIERKKKKEEERKKVENEVKERQRELKERESKLEADICRWKEKNSILERDTIIDILKEGALYTFISMNQNKKNRKTFVVCNEEQRTLDCYPREGLIDPHMITKGEENPIESLNLVYMKDVIFDHKNGSSMRLTITVNPNNGISKLKTLCLQPSSPDIGKTWATCLRYVMRNVKNYGHLSPPHGDPARGNLLAAKYLDQVNQLLDEMKQLEIENIELKKLSHRPQVKQSISLNQQKLVTPPKKKTRHLQRPQVSSGKTFDEITEKRILDHHDQIAQVRRSLYKKRKELKSTQSTLKQLEGNEEIVLPLKELMCTQENSIRQQKKKTAGRFSKNGRIT